MRPAPNLPTRLLSLFFYWLYQPLAWSYDLVAWLVSLGRWKSWIFSILPEVRGPRVLELGHGPGHLQAELFKRGFQPFGLDRSPQMGHLAARRLKAAGFRSNLVRADAAHLPYANEAFDQVVATFPSEYIIQAQTLAEAHRVIRANGSFVVLPVAWIRGRSALERLAAWLFRVTGQAAEWDGRFSDPIRLAGFRVEEKRVVLPGSEVMLVMVKTGPQP